MSTRCTIIVKVGEKYKEVYCHHDGYEEHTGKILRNNYNSQAAAESIVKLGDLSFLGETLETSIFYGRDRQETGIECRVDDSYREAIRGAESIIYFWDGEKWQ